MRLPLWPLPFLLAVGCAGGRSEAEIAREQRLEEQRRVNVRRQWDQAVRDAQAGKQPVGVLEAERRSENDQAEQGAAAPVSSAQSADAQRQWIDLRLRAARAVLVSKEALMAWRYVVHQLRYGPVQGFALYSRRQERLAEAIHQRQSLMNWVEKSLKDLEQVESGDLTVKLNAPAAFPRSVQDGDMLNWISGTDLADGRYRIECPIAHDPRLEDGLSLRAEARALEAQEAAIADRSAVLIPVVGQQR
ncbi:MAG: hypothetical protein AB7N76_12665 [Planctomycetota bacterium]